MALGKGKVQHSFLVIPECPARLMGRDLLTKLRAQITFEPGGPKVSFLNLLVCQPMVTMVALTIEDEYQLYTAKEQPWGPIPQIWLDKFPNSWAETAGLGLAANQPPVVVTLKATATPVRIKHYLSKEAREGIRPHIHRLLALGILKPC